MARRLIVTVLFAFTLLFLGSTFYRSDVKARAIDFTNGQLVAQENSPPVLDLNGGEAGQDFDTFYVVGDAEVSIVGGGLSITDDDTDLNSATITITNLKDTGAESLVVDVSGTGIGVLSNSDGLMVVSGNDTVANYEKVLRTIAYQNTSPTPDLTTRQVSFVVNDGELDSNKPVSAIQIVNPSISINKGPDTQTIVKGSSADFSIQVENTGNVTLKNIIVTDPNSTDCEENITSLNPGAVQSISCKQPNVISSFKNQVSVIAEDDFGNTVNASDTADVLVIEPGISINKTPDNQTIASGNSVNFAIQIKNTGDVTLKNVAVTDPNSTDCEEIVPTLPPGGVHNISCTQPNVTQDFTNLASVEGEDDFGNKVNASDTANVTVAKPGISISKKLDTQVIIKGSSANFTIEVENTGNVTLKNIKLSDPNSTDCEKNIPSLNPGATQSISCSEPNVTASFTNQVSVAAEDNYGNTVNATDSAIVQVVDPQISISKGPDSQIVVKGRTANFSIQIQNIGDVALKDVQITDPKVPDCERQYTSLAPGDKKTIPCVKSNVTSAFTNQASVKAMDNFGHQVSATDSASVQVIDPDISISKGPDLQAIPKGGTAVFTIEVRNTGDVPLNSIKVKDDQAPNCARPLAPLDPGKKTSYSCSLTGIDSDFINKASVEAKDNYNNPWSDIDSAMVEIENPDIRIIKSPSSQTIKKGETAKFNITVVNPSDVVDLTDVQVDDPLTPDCDEDIGILEKGEDYFYTCTKEGVTEPFKNVIEVTGRNVFNNQTVSDTSNAYVEILDMDIGMSIDPFIVTNPGDPAKFTVMVENRGSVPFKLESLVVDSLGSLTDPDNSKLNNNDCVGAFRFEIEPGETFECIFYAASEEETGVYTYSLSVTGKDDDDNLITDSASPSLIIADSAMVQVSLTAVPNSLPAPETTETIEETIIIKNLSKESTFTLNTLIHSELGSLKNACSLPMMIEAEESYDCIIELEVAGEIGDRFVHEVSAAGSIENGMTAGNKAQVTIELFDERNLNIWLPVISRKDALPEEVDDYSDDKCKAFPIFPNTSYQFNLDDEYDWFEFYIQRSGDVRINIDNLVSRDAQVTVYANEVCSNITAKDEKDHDGDITNSQKELKFIANKGRHFIRIINRDPKSKNLTYSLFITAP